MFARIALTSLLVAACNKAAPTGSGSGVPSSAPSTAGPGSAAAPNTPAPVGDVSRATTIMNTQLAAIKADQEPTLVDTFSSDAVVLVPDPRLAHRETTGLRDAISRLHPQDKLSDIKVGKLVANANATAVWWSAELTLAITSDSTPKNLVIRVTELATAESNWKVVVGAFGELRGAEAGSESSAIVASATTPPGPLTPFAGDVTKLDAALASQAVVFGTDKGEAAFDAAAAHALLRNWSKLPFVVDGKPRELHGKDWGYAITNVNWQQPKEKVPARMSALVIGTPVASGWQVVAVQYTAN